MLPQDVTIFFVLQRGPLSLKARLLALSIREFLDPAVKIRAAIPRGFPEPNRDTLGLMEHLKVEAEYFTPVLAQKYDYKIGNKLDASLLHFDTPYAMFLDTDTLFLRPVDWAGIFRNNPGLAAQHIMGRGPYFGEAGQAFRKYAEDEFDIETMALPAEPSDRPMDLCGFPVFNAGAVLFRTDTGFAQHWYEITTKILDSTLPESLKRPYADQSSLALVAALAQYDLQFLPRDWNVHPSQPHNTTLAHYFSIPAALRFGHIGRIVLKLREIGSEQGFDPMEEWAHRDFAYFKQLWKPGSE